MDLNSNSHRYNHIVDLKKFTKQVEANQNLLKQRGNEFELQQQLDNQGLYVKLMPNDSNMLFRAFSDALYFSQSRFKEVKSALCKFIHKHPNQMSKLLEYFYEEEQELGDYISNLKR